MLPATRSKAAGLLPAILGALAIGTTAVAAHAQTTPPANPATPTAPSTPAAAAPPQAPPPAITFNALIDGYYAYDFNKPRIQAGANATSANQIGPSLGTPGTSLGRPFDGTNNSFSLGLAEIGVSKAVNDASRLGFTAKLAYGPTASSVISGNDANNVNILQAYGTFLIPFGSKDLTVDAGKFVTHMGYEVIEPQLNWNYSRSDLFQYFVPLYASGVRASYNFTPTLVGSGYIENGWNNASYDNNVGKAYGFELTFTPSAKWSVILNGLTSSEPDTYGAGLLVVNRAKNTVEPILTYNFTSAFSAAVDANFDFGKGATPDNTADTNGTWNASGVAGYLRYAMPSGTAITLRGETFDDNKGFLTGNDAEKGSEFTLTYGIKSPLFAGAETRFEYRYDTLKDKAGDALFADSSLKGKKSQNTISVSELLSF